MNFDIPEFCKLSKEKRKKRKMIKVVKVVHEYLVFVLTRANCQLRRKKLTN